jgi:DNA/RNA-binding domain of Phe-tRNA-synthetase-like protein
MPVYSVEDRVFEMFPHYRRAVLVARDLDNSADDPETAAMLVEAASRVGPFPTETETARISVWNEAYKAFDADPDKFTPSIRFLYTQIRRSKPPRPISKLVDIMNAISIGWTAPCGGDDLDSMDDGDIVLGLAKGDETFAPLFKPAALENPLPGEVIYYTPQSKQVMCRRWTWRNGDFSKITPQTRNVAINIDMMSPPFRDLDLQAASMELKALLQQFCGGQSEIFTLSPDQPRFTF